MVALLTVVPKINPGDMITLKNFGDKYDKGGMYGLLAKISILFPFYTTYLDGITLFYLFQFTKEPMSGVDLIRKVFTKVNHYDFFK